MSHERCAVTMCRRFREEGSRSRAGSTPETRLCLPCFDGFRGRVAALPQLYQECEERLVGRRRSGFERIRGGLPQGVSLSEEVVDARAEMLAVVSSWAGLVADERPVPVRPRRDMSELCDFLLAHLDWLAGHPAAGEAATELARITEVAGSVTESRSATRVTLGRCAEPNCSGMVYATVGAASTPGRVSCDFDHLWRPNEWLLLGRRLRQGQRRENVSVASADVAP